MNDQPTPLPTLEEVAARTTPEEAAAAHGVFFQQYQLAKAAALLANPPEHMALNLAIQLAHLVHRVDALLDELLAEDPTRDVRVTLRVVKKMREEMEKLTTVALPRN